MFRFRNLFLILGCAVVLAALFFTDPDHGIDTGMLLLGLAVCILAVAFSHITRKALMDYSESDMRRLLKKAGQSPVGAGLALIALAIIMSALLALFGRQVHAATLDARVYVPARAVVYAPVLRAEQRRYWPADPAPWLLAGLVEQESCVRLTSPRCWSPAARLKTTREEGAGMGQITRAYRHDGSQRFDALADLRERYADEMNDLSWDNVYSRADLQLRAIVLMSRGNYQDIRRVVTDPSAALAFADAAYNGGMNGVQSDRRACNMTRGCDPQQWFGHVENTCTKSRAALYGQRSACDINREHVRNVLRVRSDKYRALMGA